MPTTKHRPFSRSRYLFTYLGLLFVLNLIPALDGHGRAEILYFDALVVALFAGGAIATRIWPDKIGSVEIQTNPRRRTLRLDTTAVIEGLLARPATPVSPCGLLAEDGRRPRSARTRPNPLGTCLSPRTTCCGDVSEDERRIDRPRIDVGLRAPSARQHSA
jgi:hypothetical protein